MNCLSDGNGWSAGIVGGVGSGAREPYCGGSTASPASRGTIPQEVTMALDPEITLSGESLEAWRDFARSLREVRGSPRTIQSYGEAVAQLQRWLNDHEDRRPVLLADRRDISGYLETCPSATTARNRHSALRSFYKFCAAEDICEV